MIALGETARAFAILGCYWLLLVIGAAAALWWAKRIE